MTRQRNESIAQWLGRCEARAARLDASPHVVYRAFDDAAILLYVGCTVNFDQRMRYHRGRAPWYQFVAAVTTTPYPDKAQARAAEKVAIDTEAAYFNATQTDIDRTQSNLHAASRMLWDAGIYQPHLSHVDDVYDPDAWAAHEADSDAWYELRAELRAELKETTHPYATPEDRMERYLAARAEFDARVAS